ncbi:hypothetical protein B7463_g6044, partial [Scytalidium lignicola]
MKIDFPPIPKDEFVIYAKLQATPNNGDQLEHHLRKLIRLTEKEAGTLDYVISRDPESTDTFHVYEKYTGRVAFEKHIGAKEFIDFAESGLLAEQPRPKMLKPLPPL